MIVDEIQPLRKKTMTLNDVQERTIKLIKAVRKHLSTPTHVSGVTDTEFDDKFLCTLETEIRNDIEYRKMPHAKTYVLVFRGRGVPEFFQSQNAYLGSALVSQDIGDAAALSWEDAENYWNCMASDERKYWEIWTVKEGFELDTKSEKHLISAKRRELEKQLRELEAKERQE